MCSGVRQCKKIESVAKITHVGKKPLAHPCVSGSEIDVMIGKGIAQAARKMAVQMGDRRREVGSMGIHAGNGTAFSAVAPSERPARAAHRS
jgi:hypothetical protein